MALRFMDSFDHYDTLASKWTSVTNVTNTQTSYYRNGTRGFMAGVGGTAYVAKTLDNQQTWVAGGALYQIGSGSGSVGLEFLDGATIQIGVYVNSGGTLSVKRGGGGGTTLATSVNSISTLSWYYIELKAKIDSSTGTYEVKVNGTSVGWIPEATGANTQQSANAYANIIRYGSGSGGTSGQCAWDDVYVCDTSGSTNNDFLGDVRVATIMPDSAGTYTEWTPSAGSNYQCVDEIPPNTTDYVATSGVGNRDTYGYAALPVASGTILGVQVIPYARKDDAGSRFLNTLVYYNSVLYSGSSSDSVGDSYTYYPDIYETNPDTEEAWTISEIDNTEFGVRLEG